MPCIWRSDFGCVHATRLRFSGRDESLTSLTESWTLRCVQASLPKDRPLLHAQTLGFEHPITGKALHFEARPWERARQGGGLPVLCRDA